MAETLYPEGYDTALVTLAQLDAKHGGRMHPEYRRRLFPWLESMGGLIGIGGGWRAGGAQPDKPGFAEEGKSFHQNQLFASSFVGYCAVDLVARKPGNVHRAPTWAESETAPKFGLHTFITGEPWHIQPIEIRGWQTWVDQGRKDPVGFAYPQYRPPVVAPVPTPVPPQTQEDEDDMAMTYITKPTFPGANPYTDAQFVAFDSGIVRKAVSADVRQAAARNVPVEVVESKEHQDYLASIAP